MLPEPPREYRFVRRRWTLLFRLIDAVGYWLARKLAKLRGPATPESNGDVARVLLIQLDHLGDAVMTTAMLPALRRKFRDARIDVLAAPWNAGVFSARSEIHYLHLSRWNRFQRGYAWLWPISLVYWAVKLRRFRYDLAIDVRGDFTIATLMRLAGVPRRLGWPCAGGGFLLTDGVDYEPQRHEVESRRAILTALDVATPRTFAPSFSFTGDADRFISHLLGDFRRGGRPLLVFHVGAGTAAKSWPVGAWRELIGRAVVEFDANVVLVGGNGDVSRARQITEDRYWPNVMDWTGRLTLDHLAALASRAAALVGADSGPAHLAAAAGADVVVLFSGANDVARWRPWGDKVRVVQRAVPCSPCHAPKCPLADHPCMTGLAPAAVIDELRGLIDAPRILSFEQRGGDRAGRPGEIA